MPNRIAWIDFTKGVIIILMVFLHLTRLDFFSKFVMAFHMPFFFVTAGFLLNLNKWGGADNYKPFETKLVKRLLVPYFVAELLWYPIWFVVCHEAGLLGYSWDWCDTEPLQAFTMIFIGNGNEKGLLLGPCWFLPCLLVAEIIFIKLYNRLNALGAETFGLAVALCSLAGLCISKILSLPMGIDIALAAQIFILAGVLIRKCNFIERLTPLNCGVLTLFLTVAFCLNVHVDMNFRRYGEPFLFYTGGISGTLLVMKLSALMTSGKLFALISACGRQSLMILVMHPIVANVFYEIIAATTSFPPEAFFYEPAIIFGATLLGVLVPLFIAERFGKLPVLKYFCP